MTTRQGARGRDDAARRPLCCHRCGNWWHDAPTTWWTQQMREDGQSDLGYSPDQDGTPVLCPPSDVEGPIPLIKAVSFRRVLSFVFPSHWDDDRGRLVYLAEAWWLKKIDATPEWTQHAGMRSFKAELDNMRSATTARHQAQAIGGGA